MQEIRNSIKVQEEKDIQDKTFMLYDAMKQKGLDAQTILTPDLDLIMDIKDNPQHIQWQILTNCYYDQTHILITMEKFQQSLPLEEINIKCLIGECTQWLKRFHLEIQEQDWNLNINQEYRKQLQEQLQILDKQEIQCEENDLRVSYIQEKPQQTDLFKHYRIKYKMGGPPTHDNHPTYLSLYSYNDARTCSIPLTPDIDVMNFYVFGQERVQTEDEDYKIISAITLPFDEIFTALKYKQLNQEIIPTCYLELSYLDETLDTPYKESSQFEIKQTISLNIKRFDLRLTKQGRIQFINRILSYYERLDKDLQELAEKRYSNILSRLHWIGQIIQPFQDYVQYIRGQGLTLKKKDQRACQGCSIQ